MRTLATRVAIPLLALALSGCGEPEEVAAPEVALEPADIVLRQGYVYTADAQRRIAEGVAIRGRRIVAVGSNAEVARFIGPETVVAELGGRMVMPGIHDTHVHALGTVEPAMCDFRGEAKSLEEMVPFLQDCLARFAPQPGQWLVALQWPFSRGNEPSERYPTLRAALDAVSTEHPVMLAGDDGHHGAANSAALALAKDASGKVVGLDRESLTGVFAGYREYVGVDAAGEPNGALNEGARMLVRPELFQDFLGANSEPAEVMPRVAAMLASRGITSIHDPAVAPETLGHYRWLEQGGQMSFRLRAGLYVPPVDSRAAGAAGQIAAILQRFEALRAEYKRSRLIRVDGVKLFADAVLEGNPLSEPPALPGAAVLGHFHQPLFRFDPATQTLDVRGYADLDGEACAAVRADPAAYAKPKAIARFREAHGHLPAQCTRGAGVLEHSEAFIREFVAQATRAGFNVHVHAISDRGVRVAVDAFEAVHAEAKRRGLTQSLAHLQLVHPEEQKRIGALGIYSTFTYAWIVPDIGYNLTVVPFIEKVSGRDGLFDPTTYYMKNVYPVRAIKTAGGIPTWGSDAPVESRDPRPFLNLEQAVTRALDGRVLTADNAIDIHAALAAFTIDGARMLGLGEKTGSLEAGKLADLVVLDQNLVELAERGEAGRISETRVLTTIFDGRVVYEDTPSGGP